MKVLPTTIAPTTSTAIALRPPTELAVIPKPGALTIVPTDRFPANIDKGGKGIFEGLKNLAKKGLDLIKKHPKAAAVVGAAALVLGGKAVLDKVNATKEAKAQEQAAQELNYAA